MHANMPQTTDFTSRGLYSAYSLSLALPLNAMSLASFCVDKHGSTYSFLVIVQNSSVWMCHNILISIAGHMSNFRVVIKCMLLLLLSRFSRVRLCATPRRQPTRLPRPWDFPDKNTGVGCHFLLQCMKVKSESEVAQSCLTLSDPTDCGPPGSSVHGIFQARMLEWGAIAFSRLSPTLCK